MRAMLSDAKVLKLSIDAISNMIDEAGIEASDSGLRLRAMDPAHVAMVDFLLPASSFDEYECGSDVVLGVDLDRLNTILKRAGASDAVELIAEGEEPSSLQIVLHGRATRRFSLPLIAAGGEELRVPELSFLAEVEVDPKVLSEAIKSVEIISEHVVLSCDSEAFRISAEGYIDKVEEKAPEGPYNVEIVVPKDEAMSFRCEQPCRSMFSIEYLRDMTKAGDITDIARLSIGNDIPLKLDYPRSLANLSFLLAPCFEE